MHILRLLFYALLEFSPLKVSPVSQTCSSHISHNSIKTTLTSKYDHLSLQNENVPKKE